MHAAIAQRHENVQQRLQEMDAHCEIPCATKLIVTFDSIAVSALAAACVSPAAADWIDHQTNGSAAGRRADKKLPPEV